MIHSGITGGKYCPAVGKGGICEVGFVICKKEVYSLPSPFQTFISTGPPKFPLDPNPMAGRYYLMNDSDEMNLQKR